MKNKFKNILTTTVDCTFGILRNYVRFLRIVIVYLGSVILSSVFPSNISNWLNKYLHFPTDALNIKEYIQSGEYFTTISSVYVFIAILCILCELIQILSRWYADKKDLYNKITNISEISGACCIILVSDNIHKGALSLNHIFIMCIALAIYDIISIFMTELFDFDFKYVKIKKTSSAAPLDMAKMVSENPTETSSEEKKTELKPLTVQSLINKLEKLEEMDVAVRCNCRIVDALDVFECESDGVPFVCIDCDGNKNSSEEEVKTDE